MTGARMLLVVALAGCFPEDPPENHSLTDLYHPTLRLNTGALPGGAEQVQLFLHPELTGVCHPIPTLAATLGGKPMTRLTGKVPGDEDGKGGYDRDCSVYEFTIDAASVENAPATVVTVTDGVSTYTMEVASLFAPRTLTPSAAEVKPGDTLTVAWTPPTDVRDPAIDVGFELRKGDEKTLVRGKDVTVGAGTLSFTVPPEPTGDVTVSLFGTLGLQPAVTRCEGAFKCSVSRLYDVEPFPLKVTKP